MNKLKLSIAICAFATSFSSWAQFNQTINVQGKYVPEVLRQERINTSPKSLKFAIESNPLDYEQRSVIPTLAPIYSTMPATGWRDSRAWQANKGYLEVGSGSYLNSMFNAGYRILDDENSNLGVALQHESSWLWRPQVSQLMANQRMMRSDETIRLYAGHNLPWNTRLQGDFEYRLGNFNYYGFDPQWGVHELANSPTAPTQTFNQGALRLDWGSRPVLYPDQSAVSWNVGALARVTGYRALYAPFNPGGALPAVGDGVTELPSQKDWVLRSMTPSRESHMNLHGDFNFQFTDYLAAGITSSADALFYTQSDAKSVGLSFASPANYGLVSISPYLSARLWGVNLRGGVRTDIAMDAGKESTPYKALHFAPEVHADYSLGIAHAVLDVSGGTRLNTLASGANQDYYQLPALTSTAPTYTPFDGRFTLGVTPGYGITAEAWAGYRISRGELLGGWYQTALNYGADQARPFLPLAAELNGNNQRLVYDLLSIGRYNLAGFSFGGSLGYSFQNWVKLQASASWQPQDKERGYFNGYDRARTVADVSLESNPWSSLKLTASWHWRGGREIYALGKAYPSPNQTTTLLVGTKLPNWQRLNLSAEYSLDCGLSFWAQGANLLNSNVGRYPSLPEQGLQVMLGAGYRF